MVTDPQTNIQTGPITIHCAAKLNAQCRCSTWRKALTTKSDSSAAAAATCLPGLINAGCLLLNPAAGAVALCSSLFVYHFMFTSEKEVICFHLCLSVILLSGLLETSDENLYAILRNAWTRINQTQIDAVTNNKF